MSKERIVRRIPVQEGSGNVYADLCFRNPEEMMVKAQLVTKIAEIIRELGLTQAETAKRLGLTQPKISKLLRGQFRGISEPRLLRCLTSLGRDVKIVVSPAPRRRSGQLRVLFAARAELEGFRRYSHAH